MEEQEETDSGLIWVMKLMTEQAEFDFTFLKAVLPILLLPFLLQRVVGYVELEVSKIYFLRRLPPGATGVFPLCVT